RSFHPCDLVLAPPEHADHPTITLKVRRNVVEIGRRAALGRMDEIRALVERGRRGGCRAVK
ncbi:MAG: hypothetical protein KJ062_08240, partial [Thermoanaerobaculia bacterium]|nr:hypothetical protein [Thermoanaerobaculia bacterium]